MAKVFKNELAGFAHIQEKDFSMRGRLKQVQQVFRLGNLLLINNQKATGIYFAGIITEDEFLECLVVLRLNLKDIGNIIIDFMLDGIEITSGQLKKVQKNHQLVGMMNPTFNLITDFSRYFPCVLLSQA